MIKLYFITACFCLFCLAACDFTSDTVVINISSKSKKIKVVPPIGSRYVVDTDFLKYSVKKFDFHSLDNSYTFNLDTGKGANVEHQFNSQVYLKQKVIVDDYDTIDLQNDKRVKKSTSGTSLLIILK
jgi:hypothetical protein